MKVDHGVEKCFNRDVEERVFVWQLEHLFVFWACEEIKRTNQHDEVVLISVFMKQDAIGNPIPEVTSSEDIRKALANCLSPDMMS